MTTKERLSITIPAALKAELEQSVSAGKRAEFTAQALQAALKKKARRELRQALKDIKPVSPKIGSVEVVREIRQQRSDRLAPQ